MAATPDESHYNPIGSVHGGFFATLLDSVCGCAVQTTLPAGTAYTSLDLNVSFLRGITSDTGRVVATGRVTKPGIAGGIRRGRHPRLAAAGCSPPRPRPAWCSRPETAGSTGET